MTCAFLDTILTYDRPNGAVLSNEQYREKKNIPIVVCFAVFITVNSLTISGCEKLGFRQPYLDTEVHFVFNDRCYTELSLARTVCGLDYIRKSTFDHVKALIYKYQG